MKLIIEDDEGHKTTVPFVRDEITVGRQEGNTIRLTERNVSRRHARFFKQQGGIFVEDLRSSNGIKVNGDKIDGAISLKEGDLVQIGDFDLAVQGEASHTTSNGATGRAAQPTEQIPALDVDTVNGLAMPDIDSDPSRPASAPNRREATSVIRVPLSVSAEAGRAPPPASAAVDIGTDEAPRLVITTTELAGREFACIRSVLTLGRGDECDIVINHRSLSRAHCRLEREPSGSWKVVDLGSSNRLQLNGEEYSESALHTGDVIGLGHVKLRFCAPGDDYVYAPEGSPKKRSSTPIIAGAAISAAVIVGGLFFYVAHKKKPPEHPIDTVAGTQDLIAGQNPQPEVAVKDPVKPIKAPEIPVPVKPEVAVPVKPEVAVPVKPEVAVKPEPEPKPAAALDADAQKLNAALAEAQVRLTKNRDPKAGLAILDKVKDLGVGDSRYAPLVQNLQDENTYEGILDDFNKNHRSAPTADSLSSLGEIPPNSVFYSEAHKIIDHYGKLMTKAAAKSKDKKVATAKQPDAVVAPVQAAPAGDDKSKRAQDLRKQGLDKIKKGDVDGALPLLQRAVELDGNSSDNLRALAGLLARMDQFDKAVVYYRRFLELAPTDPSAPQIRQAISDYESSSKK